MALLPFVVGFVVSGIAAILLVGFAQAMSDSPGPTPIGDYGFALLVAVVGGVLASGLWGVGVALFTAIFH